MWVCTGEREEKGGRKYRHERECGESKHERESSTEVRSVRCAVDLDLKLYSPHSLSQCLHFCSYSWTPLSPPAIPSTTRNPSLQHSSPLPPSLAPSIPGGAAAWVAGGGRRRDLGAPSQEANRCSPSGVSQMADIKKSWGGQRKMKTSLRMSRPQSSAHFSPPFWMCLARFFPIFFFPVRGFYKFCSNVWGQWITFGYFCCFHTRTQLAEVSAEAPTGRKYYGKTTLFHRRNTQLHQSDTYICQI